MPSTAFLSYRVPWELQLFDGIRNGPIVVKKFCTPDEAVEITRKIEKGQRDYEAWCEYGGEVGYSKADDVYLELIKLAGAEFEVVGVVTFLLVNKQINQVWSLKEGAFTLEGVST